jgi:Fur family ferric uptake transcriptional regulator
LCNSVFEKGFHLAIDMALTENKIVSLLRQRGYKVTTQRRAVIKAVSQSREHLTPSAIYERVHHQNPKIGLVTVYRTIDMLVNLGLICELHSGSSCRSYLIKVTPIHHHHLICSDCGRVVNFQECDLKRLEKQLIKSTGYKIQSHLLEFLGLCRECCSVSTN